MIVSQEFLAFFGTTSRISKASDITGELNRNRTIVLAGTS